MATHETKSGYILESDDESKRLSNQHEVIKAAMGGILLRAPVDFAAEGLRVLDSGTADGVLSSGHSKCGTSDALLTLIFRDLAPRPHHHPPQPSPAHLYR